MHQKSLSNHCNAAATLPDSQCLSLTSGYLWILKRDCINYVVESKWKVRAALITKI